MVEITTQTTGSLTIRSVEELLKLSNDFGKQLANLSGSLWLWRISAVTSLAVGVLTTITAATSSDSDERTFAILVTGLSTVFFVYSLIRWSSISGQISNVSFLHQRSIELLNNTY